MTQTEKEKKNTASKTATKKEPAKKPATEKVKTTKASESKTAVAKKLATKTAMGKAAKKTADATKPTATKAAKTKKTTTANTTEKTVKAKAVKPAVVELDYNDPKVLAEEIGKFLDAKKAKDISIVDIAGKTVIADYFVIASATSTTAVKSLSEYVEEQTEKRGVSPLRKDFDPKWMAMDYGSVIVHIFYAELREFYSIERLWTDGENIKKL